MSASIGPASTRRRCQRCQTRRDAMYGQCDMFHGLDPDSPTRPCGYGDPMLSSVQPGSPAASCAVLAMTDERAEPLSLAEASIKHWGRPGPPAPLALLLLLSCGVQAAADAPPVNKFSSPVVGSSGC